MTKRLLLSYVGLAVLILVVLEVPFGLLEARHERNELRAQTTQEATSLALAVTPDLVGSHIGELRSLVREYGQETGGTVAVFDANGHAEVVTGGGAAMRSTDLAEAKAALAGQSASAMVHSSQGETSVAAVDVGPVDHRTGAVVLLAPTDAYTDRTQDVWTALGVLAVAVLALTVIVGLALARSLTRPISRLGRAVADLGDGNLASRAEVGAGPAEMVTLSRQFNHMADRLEQLVDAQSRFVADASHQLRSPLTALRLRLENLEADIEGRPAEGLAAAGREVQRLARLVDGLLALGRSDGPGTRRPVTVAAVVAERCDSWSALAAERGVVLDWTRAVAAPVVPLVPGDLDQILDNLVANALDASPTGSTIHVEVCGGGSEALTLHVIDQGPGMNGDQRLRAFDRFWQGPGRRGGHSGLGLAIVRQLALRNGIEVHLDPAPEGGLDAVVRLAVGARHPTAAVTVAT